MTANGDQQVPLSEFLRRYTSLPPEISAYAAKLEQVALAGHNLAAQIRVFVSQAGAGDTAERVQYALEHLDQTWAELAEREQPPPQVEQLS